MGKLNSKITKEYDITSSNPFVDVLGQREHSWKEEFRFWLKIKWDAIEILYYNIKRYFKNCIKFNKMMWKYIPWEYHSQVDLFAFGLDLLAKQIENGYEVHESRDKKVAAIRRLIELFNKDYEEEAMNKKFDYENDVITHVCEYDDGSIGFEVIDERSKQIQSAIVKTRQKMIADARKEYYDEIFRILRGQDEDELHKQIIEKIGEKTDKDTYQSYQKKYDTCYYELFDGTGIEGWWD